MRGFSIIIGLFVLASCKTSQDPLPDIGLDYFPLQVGSYIVYSVDETQINQSSELKSVYELKLLVSDSLINQEGGYTYLVSRQKRNGAALPWIKLDTWTARIANRQGIIGEGNTSFVKLTFPTVNGSEWDGNTFNTLGGEQTCGNNQDRPCDIYRLENMGMEFTTASGMMFDETLTVVQNENTDLIVLQDVRKEIYAKHVGLIYKESIVLEYCTSASCLGQQKVTKGVRFKQVIKEYGVE